MAEPNEPVVVGGECLEVGFDGRDGFGRDTHGVFCRKKPPEGCVRTGIAGELRSGFLVLEHAVSPVGGAHETLFRHMAESAESGMCQYRQHDGSNGNDDAEEDDGLSDAASTH